MFAKLSALALCASLVSALSIQLGVEVAVGAQLPVDISNVKPTDPSSLDFVLVSVDVGVAVVIGKDVAVQAEIDLDIPGNTQPGNYVLEAYPTGGDHSTPTASSRQFTVVPNN